MAPLDEALRLERVGEDDGEDVYRGHTDKEWSVGSIPFGGYIVGLAVTALTESQKDTQHTDPMQLSAHFLKPAVQGAFELRVGTLRRGKQFTALRASFVQNNEQRVFMTSIFTDLSPSPVGVRDRTLRPPHPRAPQIPLYSHPAVTPAIPETPGWTFAPRLTILRDPYYAAGLADPAQRGLALGHWFAWKDTNARLSAAALSVFADCFMPLVSVLLEPELGERDIFNPTVALHIEFKARVPRADAPHHSPRALAVYNTGRFVHDPLMRHDTYVELWTAPRLPSDPPGDGARGESDGGAAAAREAQHPDWRRHQRCLAVAYQTSVVLGTRDLGNRKGKGSAQSSAKL